MKKIFVFLLSLVVFISFSDSIQAKMLTPTEVFNDFKTSFIDPMNTQGGELSTTVNETSKTYTVYAASEPIIIFNYTDGYVEYDHRSEDITQDNIEKELGAMFCYDAMVNSILKLSGYGDKTIRSDEFPELEDTFNQYGYQVSFEHHNFEGTDEGGSWSMSGDFIKYFKMSFDTSKIDALMNRYGIDKEEYENIINNNNNDDNDDDDEEYYSDDDGMNELLENMTTTLEIGNITTNSITIKPFVLFGTSRENFKIYCNIYRSTSENGTYDKITDEPINCFNSDSYTDTGLKSNTTYYYKTKIIQSNKYSEVYAITTKAEGAANAATNSNKGDTVKNPETGVVTYTAASIAVIIASIVALIYTRKKNAFKKL